MSRRRILRIRPAAILALWMSVAGAAAPQGGSGAGAAELPELPRPNLEHLDERVQAQLLEARESLEAVLVRPDVEPGELAEAFGEIGRLYFLYDLVDLAEICFQTARRLTPEDYRWLYFLGVLYEVQGDFAEAVRNLELVREMRARDLPTLLRLGNLHLKTGSTAAAREAFEAAQRLEPDSAAALFGLSRLALEDGEVERAIQGFERVLELQPAADAVHFQLGMAYRQLGDLERAREHLAKNRAAQVRFEDPLLKNLSGLIRSAQVLFSAGVKSMRQGEYDAAIEQFMAAGREDPEDALIPYNVALAYLQKGMRSEAENYFRKTLEIDPEFRNGHFNLAIFLAEQDRLEEAAYHFGRAHDIDPEDRRTHLEWATALSRIGRREEAAREFHELLETEPQNPEFRLRLGALQAQLGRRQEADANLRSVLDLDSSAGQKAEAHARLAALLEESGNPASIDHYLQAAELQPESLERRLALSYALGRAGRFREAAGSFELAIELDRENVAMHFGRAMALVMAESYADARTALEESLAAHSGNVPLRHLLARLLATCPDETVRDGARAVVLAEEVLRSAVDPEHGETLAMALAEAGRFREAAELQRRLIQEFERKAPPARIELARRRLALYERGEPVRAPWKRGG